MPMPLPSRGSCAPGYFVQRRSGSYLLRFGGLCSFCSTCCFGWHSGGEKQKPDQSLPHQQPMKIFHHLPGRVLTRRNQPKLMNKDAPFYEGRRPPWRLVRLVSHCTACTVLQDHFRLKIAPLN